MTTRQTRRNTVAMANSQGTLAMDPWQDDRFRDFMAINVIARVRAFHRRSPPSQHPPPSLDTRMLVGAQNQQRAQNLLVLPPTDAFCDGTSLDCPVRRVYSRIFGPTLLHHEAHEQMSHAVAASHRVVTDNVNNNNAADASGGGAAQLGGANCLDTPLHPTRSDGDTPAIRIEEPPAEGDHVTDPVSAAARPLFEIMDTAASSAGNMEGGTPATAAPETTTTTHPRASSASLAAVATAGSATPLDYHTELDCACCESCCEAIAHHYQQLLNKGVVAERFSVKELLFAHWVIFRNMDGPAMDAHSSGGRKEGLSITMKSGYYALLKVPKVEEDTTSSPPLHSLRQGGGVAPTSSSSAAPLSMPAPLPVGQASSLSAAAVASATRKRRRAQEAEATPAVEESNETDTKPRLLGELHTKTYATRRALAAHSQTRDASISSQPLGDPQSRQATAPPSPHVAAPKRGGALVKPDAKASAPSTLLFPPAVKEEEVLPPHSPSTVAASPTTEPPPPFVGKRSAAAAAAAAAAQGQPLRQSVHVMHTIVPLDSRAAVRLANLKSKVEQQAYERLVQEQLFPVVPIPASFGAAAAGDLARENERPTTTTTAQTIVSSKVAHSITPSTPQQEVTPADERCLLAVAATASSERRLSRFTFGQQCLLMLAADRIMRPDVPLTAASSHDLDIGRASGGGRKPATPAPRFDYWAEHPR